MRKTSARLGPNEIPASGAIDTLLEDLTSGELERVAAAVIREHRCRLQMAEDAFEEIGRLEGVGAQDQCLDRLQDTYRIALLNLHVQHQLVSLVVTRLGYVPEVDGQRMILN